MSYCLRSSALLALLAIATHACLQAQSSASGAIAGRIHLRSGQAVAQARVIAISQETDRRTETRSDAQGFYLLALLEPGFYAIVVEAQGLQMCEQVTATTELGRVTDVSLTMQPLGVATSVEVRDEAPLIEHDEAARERFDQTQLTELPSLTRRWSSLALLTPTTTPDGDYGLLSFRGLSGSLNTSLVDGADNNQAFFSEERGRTRASYVMGQTAVREFLVNTSNFSAEYGRAAGGAINAVTRSGGKRLHGEAFYYRRDSAWGAGDANAQLSYYSSSSGAYQSLPSTPVDRRQIFGGNLGGPILKQKLYFFFNYDQQQRDFPAVSAASSRSLFDAPCVLTKMAQLNLTLIGLKFRANCQSDEFSVVRKVMPVGSTDDAVYAYWMEGVAYLNSFTGKMPRRADHLILFPKIDWNLSPREHVTVSYNRLRWRSPAGMDTAPVVNRGVYSGADSSVRVDSINAQLSSALSARAVHQLRLQWSRDLEYDLYRGGGENEPHTGPWGNAPEIDVGGYAGLRLGMPTLLPRKSLPDERRLELANSLAIERGPRTYKFGGGLNRVSDFSNSMPYGGGRFNYASRNDFIADYLMWRHDDTAGWRLTKPHYTSYTQAFGGAQWSVLTWDVDAWAQMNWRLAQCLTLNLGARYEREILPAALLPNVDIPATARQASGGDNFAPRLGFAWAPKGRSRGVLRGGVGLYYSRISNATALSVLSHSGEYASQRTYVWRPTLGQRFPLVGGDPYGNLPVSTEQFAANLRAPRVWQGDLVAEGELGSFALLTASYLLSLGDRLQRNVDINLVDPATTGAVQSYGFVDGPYAGKILTIPLFTQRLNNHYARMTEARSDGSSSYHALAVQLRRRGGRRGGFTLSYAWAHSIDNAPSSSLFAGDNSLWSPYGGAWWMLDGVKHTMSDAERASSNFDVRQKLTAHVLWSPRLNSLASRWLRAALDRWTITPTATLASGRPFTEYIDGDAPNTPDSCESCMGVNGSGGEERLPFLSRNAWRKGATYNVDLRISREARFGDRRRLTLFAEAFNLLNHSNTSNVDSEFGYIAGSTIYYNADFGARKSSTSAIYRSRQIQLGARLSF